MVDNWFPSSLEIAPFRCDVRPLTNSTFRGGIEVVSSCYNIVVSLSVFSVVPVTVIVWIEVYILLQIVELNIFRLITHVIALEWLFWMMVLGRKPLSH